MAGGAINLLDQVPQRAIKTFDIGASNLTGTSHAVFTVTGMVLIEYILGYCRETLVGASTIELGVLGNTAGLIDQATATDLATNEIWHDATPTTLVEAITAVNFACTSNIILTTGATDITDGILDIICLWKPLSNQGFLGT